MTAKKIAHCKNCDKELNERHKIYCDHVCQNQYHNDKKVSDWIQGWNPENKEIPDPIRRHLFATAKHKCTQCNWSGTNPVSNKSVLVIDHIDGDATNNRRENLRVLCPNCHALTPTFGNLNKGKGRAWRYKNALVV